MPEQDEEDVARYYGDAPSVAIPQNVEPSPNIGYSERFGSPAPVIKAAVAQLNAGQPVTALPRVSFSYDQQQAWLARMDEFDRQAKAARMAADQAARDVQLLDQMSRVAKSTKDIEVALHQQDVIGFRNAVAGGTPPLQAFQRFPRAASAPLVSAVQAGIPAPSPKVVQLPGMAPGVQSGRYGERFTFAPESSQTMPLDEQMKVANDPDTGKRLGLWARTSRGARRFIPDPVEKGLTPANRISIYNAQARLIQGELNSLTAPAALKNPSDPQHDYYKGLQDKLSKISASLEALEKGEAPSGAAAPAAKKAVRDPKTGKWKLE